MGKVVRSLAGVWMMFLAGCIVISPTVLIFASNWHDQQRIFQAFLLVASFILLLSSPNLFSRSLRGFWVVVIVCFFLVGIASAARSSYPSWSWLEVSWFAGGLGLFLCVASLSADKFCSSKAWAYRVLTSFGVLYSIKLMLFLASIYSSGAVMNSREMIDGFSNSRFFGQFSTLSFPLMVALAADSKVGYKRFALIACSSAMVFAMLASQTRGTFYGLLAGLVSLALTAGARGSWFRLFTLAAVLGSFFYLSIVLFPGWMGWVDVSGMEFRLDNFGLSGRAQLWAQAVAMVKENLLLGSGPMVFAAIHHRLGAHPHSSLAQIASEWGLLAVLCGVGLVLRSLWVLAQKVRGTPQDPIGQGLLVALVSSLVQSLVDGVLVMPLSQTMLVVTAGWAYAWVHLHGPVGNGSVGNKWRLGVTRAVALIVFVVGVSSFYLASQAEGNGFFDRARCLDWTSGVLKPRFWECGWISAPPAGEGGS